jgi:hypothetical protein
LLSGAGLLAFSRLDALAISRSVLKEKNYRLVVFHKLVRQAKRV